jgi:hypothetical protein
MTIDWRPINTITMLWAWAVAEVTFKKALALRSQIRRAGWFN